MKALVKSKAEQGLWLEEIPVPRIGINDILIQVVKTAICGTDIHIYKWDTWAANTIPVPMIVGHEFSGEIVAIGEGRQDENGKLIPMSVKVGDKVLYSKYGGTEIEYDGTKYLIMSEMDIQAIIVK